MTQTTPPRTMSAVFGDEWLRRDDWGAIGSVTIANVTPGQTYSLMVCRNQVAFTNN